MPDLQEKLSGCFATVFPSLTPAQIVNATPESVSAWDSVTSITLITVIEEEFGMTIDLDDLPELTSYAAIKAYLEKSV